MITSTMNQELELVTVGMDFLCSMMCRSSARKIPVTGNDFNVWESKVSEGFFTHMFNV